MTSLYPSRKPYRKGYFPVSDGYKLFYALYGNPRGKPVLFVHGGPGAGCGKNAHRFFDPKKFNIITVDQRGAGKSRPFASTKNNTTQKLVEDFHHLLKFLNIKKTLLFGGSWGSCLSLCYAIKYPDTVKGMVLRGIYLGTRGENDYFLNGGARTHFPDVWEQFLSLVPRKHWRNPAQHYWRMMNSKNPKTVKKYCTQWAAYENSMLHLKTNFSEARKSAQGKWAVSLARLEAHYLMNDCFLPRNYILNNAHKIAHIPTTIVHGRYDFMCTPDVAYRLHQALPKSKLYYVLAGHSASDPEIQKTLVREMKKMAVRHQRRHNFSP
ncbi:prolyl aminopeptidase [Candidatus Woesearchaeota archaeon]|nr:prolyl aminopeptidase [Candidatus Woesearchaeota archaeon]